MTTLIETLKKIDLEAVVEYIYGADWRDFSIDND